MTAFVLESFYLKLLAKASTDSTIQTRGSAVIVHRTSKCQKEMPPQWYRLTCGTLVCMQVSLLETGK